MKFLAEDDIIGMRLMRPKEAGLHFEMTRKNTELQTVHEWLCAHLQDEIKAGKKIVYTIIDKASESVCGFCQLDMENPKQPEIGIDIDSSFAGKGYGYRATSLLLESASTWPDTEKFVWTVYSHNWPSRHLAEKLGGVLVGEEPLLSKEFIEYGVQNNILKDEDITKVCKYIISKRV